MKLELIDVKEHADVRLVKVCGDLDAISAEQFRNALLRNLTEGIHRLILDFEGVRFIDSVGSLGLINVYIKAKKAGIDFVLFGMNERVKEVFDVLGASRLITIYATYEEALPGPIRDEKS